MDNNNILISEKHPVGGGLSVQFRFNQEYVQNGEETEPFTCEWFPGSPSQRDLQRKLNLCKYWAVRDQFFEDVLIRFGISIVSIEIYDPHE